jgi:hypothetical protein
MPDDLPWTSLDPAAPQTWALLGLGVAVTTLIFLAGWQVRVRASRRRRAARPPQDDLPASHSDRRATPRRRGNPVEVELSAGAAGTRPAWVVDRSYGGLCLRVGQPFAENSVVRVRSCHPDNPAEWSLHCQFLRTPNWGVLHQFG